MAGEAGEERESDGDRDQDDDDPFEQFRAASRDKVGDLAVDAVESFELAKNGCVPFGEVKPIGRRAIQTSQVLVAEKLQRVVHAFKEDS